MYKIVIFGISDMIILLFQILKVNLVFQCHAVHTEFHM
jgi:hypothetical protein